MSRSTAGLMAAAGAWSLPALGAVLPGLGEALGAELRLSSGSAVALTFDDGPHHEGTPAVLAVLEAARARATFFLVGEQVDRDPGLAAEIVAAGHAVAIHGQRHRNQLRLTPAQLADDLDRGQDSIARATGLVVDLYRPPYGIFSWPGLAAVRSRRWRPVLWSRWGRDWAARATPESIATRVTRGLRPRDVLLLHDADHYSAAGSHRRTASALPQVLATLVERGLETALV